MASCKGCLYFDVCKDAAVPKPEYKGEQPDKSKDCRCFEHKADFVEVVRCKDCIKRGLKGCPMFLINLELNGIVCRDDCFCSYGKRERQL